MDFGHRSGNEAGSGGLPDSGDPHVHNVVEAACEQLRQPSPPVVSARVRHEYTIATLMEQADDGAVGPSDESIRAPLTLASRQREARRTASRIEALPQTQTPAMRKSARIAIKAKGRILFIDPKDVIAVEARGDCVLLLHTSSSHLLRESISTVEKKLNVDGFVRIHRSVLVNAAFVEELQPWPTGEYVLRMTGGREYTVTRTYKKNLQLLARSWIGMDGFVAG